MRSVCGVLTAFVVSGSLISAAEAQRRVSLTDYCQELKLLREVTKPGLTVQSQAAILARAMQFPKFRQLVKAHREQNFSAAEIDAALLDCRGKRRTQRPDPLESRSSDPPSSDRRDPHHAALWIVLALLAAVGAGILLVRETRKHRPEKSAPLKPTPKHEPDWERNERTARRAELDELKKAIEDRSPQ